MSSSAMSTTSSSSTLSSSTSSASASVMTSSDSTVVVSPYTLFSSDNPGAVISPVTLTGENYNEWSVEMLNALQAKRKTGFINGTLPRPLPDNPNYENWMTVNSMIVGWIRSSISSSVRSTVTFISDAKLLWEELKGRFSIGNPVRVHQIRCELASCKQNGQSVLEYYGRLAKLWEEFQTYCPLPACTCGAAAHLSKEREESKVHQFLMGLDEARFGGLCQSLVSSDPLPSLGECYAKVVREEQRLASSRGREQQQEAVGFVARRESGETGSRSDSIIHSRPKMLCAECGRSGHMKKDCWQLVGFPEWWNEGGRGNGGGRGGSRGRGRGSAGVGRGKALNTQASGSSSSPFPAFSQEQWQVLSQMMQGQSSSGVNASATDKLSGKTKFGDVVLDTGASHHMTGNLEFLMNLVSIPPCAVGFADGSRTFALQMGVWSLSDRVVLNNVLYVPSLNCTLLSVSKLLKQTSCLALFSDTMCILQDRFTRTLIGTGEERDGVYYLTDVVSAKSHKVKVSVDQDLWHQRLGHPSFSVLSALPMSSSFSKSVGSVSCDACFKAKQTREVFPESSNKAKECFSLIHCDVWGPYRIPSSCGAVYFLTIVDDFSRAVWTYLLLEKSQVRGVLTNFLAYAEKQFGKQVKTVRSDNGTEFMCLSSHFRQLGIVHQTSCVATPQQNGRVERKHRHLLNVARALLFQASVPTKFWGEAVLTAAYLINRTPMKLHNGKTPYELLHGCSPVFDHLRVFGSACYVHRSSRDKDKFGERSRLCVFVGYPVGQKGWRVFDIERNEFLVSRDVVFREEVFPFAQNPPAPSSSPPSSSPICDEDWTISPVVVLPSTTSQDAVSIDTALRVDRQGESSSPVDSQDAVSTDTTEVCRSTQPSAQLQETHSSNVGEQLGRGHRKQIKSVLLRDYETEDIPSKSDTHHALFTSKSSETCQGTSLYPLTHYISNERFSAGHRAFVAAVSAEVEPKHFKEAVGTKVWDNAMVKEIDAQEVAHTWDIVDLPQGKTAIGSQWVYKIKYNADGTIERYKARLVAQGNTQVEGEDYEETFAPVVKLTTVRTLLRLVAAKGWEVYQMDVNNAFLHGDLEEEVYMKLPPGFRHTHPGKVCRLRKSLYGLKQAPRCWFKKLSDALLRFGFVQSYEDYSLFSFTRKGIELRILIYVDDLVICGNDNHMVKKFKEYLGRCFSMKDLGKLKYFLGIEVSRGPDGLFLCQRKYALDIIADSGNLGSKPVHTPLEQNHHLASDESPFLDEPTKYRRLVGRLIYLTHTRPELSYSVHILSQFMQKPREAHWTAALRVVRFLKGCPGQGILLRSDDDLSLTIYCDSDWQSCPLTRRSLSAFVVMIGSSPISWKTKKQDTVSHSSAEAEYRAMAAGLREIKWLRRLLKDLGIDQSNPTRFFCDSKAAIHIAANPVFHERTKHIEADCHAVRDAVQEGTIVTHHIGTNDQVADILTKALGRPKFDNLLSKLGVRDLHAPT